MKKTHKLISILIVLAMLLSVAPLSFVTTTAAEITMSEPVLTTDKYDINGDGTNDAVYEITDVSELYWFANLVNTKANSGGNNTANAMLMNNITVNENVIVDGALTSDTSSLNVWTAMGKSTSSSGWYAGCFDGNGKTISGLYVDETNYYRGFIGCLGEGGSIKNLTIADSYFTSTKSSLGAFVGTMGLNSAAVKPVIENCKLTGSIVSGTSYVGGIAGGADYGEIISNCHMYNSTIIGTGDNVGGIVGSAGDYNNETYIRLCSVNGGSVSGANKVGGIIGCGVELSKTKISACCNYGTSVTATTRYAGGILGEDGYCYSCFVTAKVTAPKNKGPFAGYGNHYYSAYDSDIYGEGINHISSKSFTTEEIEAGIATYFLTDTTPSNTVYVLWGQRIGEDKYPSWNPDGNQDYIVYRVDDTENGGYIYYNGDAAAEYEPNEDGIYEIANRSDWYKFAKKSKEDTAIDAVLTANIDFSGVGSDKLANYVIGVDQKAYTGTFDGDGYTVSNLPDATHPLFNIIGNGGELKDLNLSGATVTNTDTVSIAGFVYNNQGTVSNVTVTDVTVSGIYSAGIVYYNYGTVTGCTASDITVTGKTTVGGIVGVNNNGKTVENCHVLSGTVKAENADGYDGHAGGICGSSYGGTIKGCSNGADVSSEASRLETAAGIVGKPVAYNDVSVNIIECSNTGNINGSYAGGISGADLSSTDVNISLCYNEGNITGNVAGGIAADGSINATDKIINCYNAGEIKAVGTGAKAGGIVGNHSNSSIQNCHNYGKVISEYLAAPISCTNVDTWHGTDELINNYAIEGNIQAPNISPYLDTAGAASNFDAVVKGSTREEFADGTVTAKLNAGNSETVWYQYNHYPVLEERHVHKWKYSLVGTDSIKAECVNAGCNLEKNDGGSVTLVAPDELVYDGVSKDAECIFNEWKPGKPEIVYNDVDRTNVSGQNIVASVTAGEATASVSYQIQPGEIIASMVTLSKTSVSYNGTEQSTTVTVKYNSSTTLAAGTDYEVMGTTSATDIGTYTVTVIGKGNYTGTIEKTWKINKASIRPQILIDDWSYLDTPNAPTLNENPENGEVTYTYYISGGRRPVMTGTANGAETEGGVPKYAGTYYIGATITETEHYTASTISPTKQFTIAPREVSNPDFEGIQKTYLYDNGNEIKPAFTLKDDLGNVIPESEYTVTYSDNTDAGEATITITDNADGNYNISGTAKFTIITHQHDWVYTANGNVITATCSNSDGGCTDTNGGTLTISAPTDLYADGITAKEATVENNLVDTSVAVSDITYSSGSAPKTAGTYTASVTIGGATASIEYTLVKRNAAADMFVFSAPANLVYDGTAKYATVEVSPEITGMGAVTVTYYKDGVAVDPINAGTYTVKVSTEASDAYNAMPEVAIGTMTIEKKEITASATAPDKIYDGTTTVDASTVSIIFDGIVDGDDVKAESVIAMFKNANAGNNKTVIVAYKAVGEDVDNYEVYTDYVTVPENEFYYIETKANILPRDIVDAEIVLGDVLIYNGEEHTQSIASVTVDGLEVTHTVSGNTAKNVGVYQLTVTGTGNFTGEATVLYTVNPDLSGIEGLDEYNVKSTDKDAVEYVYNQLDNAETDLASDEKIAEWNEIKDECWQWLKILESVAYRVESLGSCYEKYDIDTVTSADDEALEALEAEIYLFMRDYRGNMTEEELLVVDNARIEISYLRDRIAETMSKYDSVIAAANGYDEATVTSADMDALIQLNDDIYALALTDNVTAEEKANLKAAHDKVLGMIDKITGISDEIKRIIAAVDEYVFESVKSTDKADLEQLIEDIAVLLATQNITADERALLEIADETCDKLVAKIDETVAEVERIDNETNAYDIETVTAEDKENIEQLLADIDVITDTDNLTDDERIQLNGNAETLESLLETINDVAEEIVRIEDAVNSYDESTIKSSDTDDLNQLKADIKALTDGANLTDGERANLAELDATIDALLKKIADTQVEIERIDEAVNCYDIESVNSADIQALGKLIDDIETLTNGDNITEEEKAALEDNKATIDALIEKLTEVAEEIARVNEAVNGYDEDTVKSTDKEDLAQLKEDIQAVIDGGNVTENEKTALGEMIEKVNALLDKISETEEKLEEIKGIENNFNPENVSSDDKAAIEEKIAEIEAVNPENLTEEQKAEYDEIKAGFEALLEEIEKAGSEVDAIGAELEMFDEERVTIFSKDEIEALKAKIEELLADTNMGEAEKAKLNEYMSQAEKLIEIINTPAEYFAIRIFYFIWDALHWLSSHVVFIFNWILAMF